VIPIPAAALAWSATLQAPSFVSVHTLQTESGRSPDAVARGDVDGDGALEVVIAVHARGGARGRALEIFHAGAGGAFERRERVEVTPDVVAWTLGDVEAAPGEEIVLFNARGAFAWSAARPADARIRRLADVDFLWQLPDPARAVHWPDGLRDVDADGALDVTVPEPGGYRVVYQRRGRATDEPWGDATALSVPAEAVDASAELERSAAPARVGASASRRRVGFYFAAGEEDSGGGPLLAVADDLPAPQWIDWDADRDLDLAAQTARHLHVWTQVRPGAFEFASHALPLEVDRTRRLDLSYSAHAVDLDGDRRADCAIFAGDTRASEVRTQGLYFLQERRAGGTALFGAGGKPRGALVFAGFVADVELTDVDGDSLADLALSTVRPDLLDRLTSGALDRLDTQLFVYLNRKGSFAREPDLSWKHSVALESFDPLLEFVPDLTGDAIRELAVRDQPGRVRVLHVQRARGNLGATLSVREEPLWSAEVARDADVELVRSRDGRAALAAIERKQVLLAILQGRR
jgi:hypothetical protein